MYVYIYSSNFTGKESVWEMKAPEHLSFCESLNKIKQRTYLRATELPPYMCMTVFTGETKSHIQLTFLNLNEFNNPGHYSYLPCLPL